MKMSAIFNLLPFHRTLQRKPKPWSWLRFIFQRLYELLRGPSRCCQNTFNLSPNVWANCASIAAACFPPFFPAGVTLRRTWAWPLQPLNFSWPVPGARRAECTGYFNFFTVSSWKRSGRGARVGGSSAYVGARGCEPAGSCKSSSCVTAPATGLVDPGR